VIEAQQQVLKKYTQKMPKMWSSENLSTLCSISHRTS